MAPPGMLMAAANSLVRSEATRITESEVKKQTKEITPATVPTAPQEFSEKKEKIYVHKKYKYSYKWINIIVFAYIHLTLGYNLYIFLFASKWQTVVFSVLYGLLAAMGITAGAHRLWAHKAYKAVWQLRLLLVVGHAIANQGDIRKWIRDHRSHHKFSETDADPQNSLRGYFYAHIGWLLITKHPGCLEKGKTISMADIESDPIIMWQTNYFDIIGPLFCFILPTLIPWYFWGEVFMVSWYCCCLRFALTSNATWFINSGAHAFGMRPYDKNEAGTENVIFNSITLGEGWHNYHHSFPWDYSSSEIGMERFNMTTKFIDACCYMGWASDRKTVPLEIVKRRILRAGDGSHRFAKERDQEHFWGWGDKDMLLDESEYAEVVNPR